MRWKRNNPPPCFANGSCCVSRLYFRFGCLAMCKHIILCTNRLNAAKCRKFISGGPLCLHICGRLHCEMSFVLHILLNLIFFGQLQPLDNFRSILIDFHIRGQNKRVFTVLLIRWWAYQEGGMPISFNYRWIGLFYSVLNAQPANYSIRFESK